MEQLFYDSGLRFSCVRCSACCRYDSGFVFLSQQDIFRLADECNMDYNQFEQAFCRWVPAGEGERLSLKEKSNYDCIFWKDGCTVYRARPLQCRTFPFWESILCSAQAWEAAGSGCPGINAGALHSCDEVEEYVRKREAEPLLERVI
ncbi:MAG: YkgJ family cysteine cluster protein [Treponema sp.]|jgi:Fe-S-cluster containining protein|nr:YkgJ family cysteine cluster protein [Treponema sp.]